MVHRSGVPCVLKLSWLEDTTVGLQPDRSAAREPGVADPATNTRFTFAGGNPALTASG